MEPKWFAVGVLVFFILGVRVIVYLVDKEYEEK